MTPIKHPGWNGYFSVDKEDGHDLCQANIVRKGSIIKTDWSYKCKSCGLMVYVPVSIPNMTYLKDGAYTCKEYRLKRLIK